MFSNLLGKYKGTSEVFFRPGERADLTTIEGTITPYLNDQFFKFEYTSTVQGKNASGHLLTGFDESLKQCQMVWLDTFHNGVRMLHLHSERDVEAPTLQASGTYPADKTVDWGWRIEIHPESLVAQSHNPQRIEILHYNIPPGTDGIVGVKWALEKVE